MNEAKQAKYIFGTPSAKNRAADSSGSHSILILGGTSGSLRWRRRIGAMAPIVSAETPVNAEIPVKLAAFAAALAMNGMLAAGMAYLFNAPLEQHTAPLQQHGAGFADSAADKPQPFHPRDIA
jgi:hypothetical protein